MNGKYHQSVGFVGGGITAWYLASGQSAADRLIETIGGAVAGVAGAKAPDWIDPPTSPRHRSLGHGLIPIGTLASWAISNLRGWQESLRSEAIALQAELRAESCGLRRVLLQLGILGCLLAAGAIGGFILGYLSHVVLDATTPTSIPWIG